MCGIAGFLSADVTTPPSVEAVKTMCAQMTHRGPDQDGLLVSGPVALGHRRLSIIDLRPEGAQPMTNEDGTIAVVVNGEIYNFAELRSQLVAKGHHFKSRSDSEVCLHLYEELGIDFVERLRGMFALALWDSNAQRLVLARDRIGKKPLFYHVGPRGLAFASEVQALVASRLFAVEPDLDAIDAYLALQYVPAPESAFRHVQKLPPGHRLVATPGKVEPAKAYHQLRFDQLDCRSEGAIIERLRHELDEAVRIRMVADVPVGAFLSGGIDSSIVVALMARASSQRVKTFSVGFTEKDHSELPYARQVAELYHTEHHELSVVPDMTAVLPKLVRHYGEPFADASAVPTYYLCEHTRSLVTVALSGDGGDEGFAGYNRYRYARIARAISALPGPTAQLVSSLLSGVTLPRLQPVRDFGRRLLLGEVTRYLGLIGHFPYDDRQRIYSAAMRERFSHDRVAERFERRIAGGTALDAVSRLLELDTQTYLPDDILVKVDIASMAHSLEVRAPLVDQQLMCFVAGIPAKFKLKGLQQKALLKRAAEPWLPASILHRKKQGFGLPIDRWMREDLAPMAADLLLSPRSAQRGIFAPDAVRALIGDHQRGESRGLQIWNLLMLELWFRTHIDQAD